MNDIIYNDLMQSIPNTIFDKHFRGFLKYKDDMIQTAYLQIWKSKNKFNPNVGKLESFMGAICWNTFNKFIRDNVYKDKDKIYNIDSVEHSSSDYDGRNEKTELLNSLGKEDKGYYDIEYRQLMKAFDERVIKDNKSMGGRSANLKELHYVMDKLVEGYSQTEIAKEMGVTQNCIYKKILRIKNTLSKIK